MKDILMIKYESIESVDKTRILVGLGIDAKNDYQTVQTYQNKSVLDFDSNNIGQGSSF